MYIVDAVYDLYVVGGYKDDAAKAEKLTQRFFRHLHDLTIRYTHIFMLVKIPFISKCLSAHKKSMEESSVYQLLLKRDGLILL